MQSVDGPAVQSSYMKNLFAVLARRGELPRLAEADPELVRAVDGAGRMHWLPVELNDNEIEPTVFLLPRERKIQHLEIIVLKRERGKQRGLAGFSEVALERRRK